MIHSDLISNVYSYLKPICQLNGKLVCRTFNEKISVKVQLSSRIDAKILDFLFKNDFYFFGEYLFQSVYNDNIGYISDNIDVFIKDKSEGKFYLTKKYTELLSLCKSVYGLQCVSQYPYTYYNEASAMVHKIGNITLNINCVPYDFNQIRDNRIVPSYLNICYNGSLLYIENIWNGANKIGKLNIPQSVISSRYMYSFENNIFNFRKNRLYDFDVTANLEELINFMGKRCQFFLNAPFEEIESYANEDRYDYKVVNYDYNTFPRPKFPDIRLVYTNILTNKKEIWHNGFVKIELVDDEMCIYLPFTDASQKDVYITYYYIKDMSY